MSQTTEPYIFSKFFEKLDYSLDKFKEVYNVYTLCFRNVNEVNNDTRNDERLEKLKDFMTDLLPSTEFLIPEVFDDNLKEYNKIIIGPRGDTRPTWCTIFEGIFRKAGFDIEIALKTRYFFSSNDAGPSGEAEILELLETHGLYDRMTEQIYDNISTNTPEIDVMKQYMTQPIFNNEYIRNNYLNIDTKNRSEIEKLNSDHGLSLTEYDIEFIMKHGHNWNDPILTIYDIAQSNSEHCRHHYFNGEIVIDGDETESVFLINCLEI